MMSLWDALRMNMMISYQELVRTFPKAIAPSIALPALIKSLRCILTFSIGQFEKERMGMIFSL